MAEHLLRQIHQGEGSVLAWLDGKQNQSLFRREQVRQVLSLLSDESPENFLRSVRDVLSSPDVRFHLKHLVLEILGQLDEAPTGLLDYLIALIGDEYWKPHILGTVFAWHEQYVRTLVDRGIVRDWLHSPDRGDINLALGLLRSVNEPCGDMVATILEPLVTKGGEWLQWIRNVLPFEPESDSAGLFELRLKLARRGLVREFVNWPKLAESHSGRVIQLIEAVASTWDTRSEDKDSPQPRPRANRAGLEGWTREDLTAIKAAARRNPEVAWDSLMAYVERLTAIEFNRYDANLREWQDTDPFQDGSPTIGIRGGLVAVLWEAGGAMAEHHPDALMSRTHAPRERLGHHATDTPGRICPFAKGICRRGANWLLRDTRRFAIGPGDREPKWMPAARVIKALSPHCSDGTFQELEEKITRYHSPDERSQPCRVLAAVLADGLLRGLVRPRPAFPTPGLVRGQAQPAHRRAHRRARAEVCPIPAGGIPDERSHYRGKGHVASAPRDCSISATRRGSALSRARESRTSATRAGGKWPLTTSPSPQLRCSPTIWLGRPGVSPNASRGWLSDSRMMSIASTCTQSFRVLRPPSRRMSPTARSDRGNQPDIRQSKRSWQRSRSETRVIWPARSAG